MSLLSKSFFFLTAAGALYGQLSPSTYRVLGQTDLRQNGLNLIQGIEFNQPRSVALDARGGQTRIYVSDTRNSRVLAWADVASYQIGDPPNLVLGQPNPQSSNALGIGVKGFVTQIGIAV